MIKNKNVRLYEALAHDVAMDAAERVGEREESREFEPAGYEARERAAYSAAGELRLRLRAA